MSARAAAAEAVRRRPIVWRGVHAVRVRRVPTMAAAAVLYYASAKLGFLLEFAGPVAAIVWLPVGIGISFLYLGGVGLWPGLLVGDLAANDYMVTPVGSAVGQTCGNMLEMVAATLLLRELVRRDSPLATVGGVARMVTAIAAGTAISATIGTLSLRLGGVVDTDVIPAVWRTWWLGDATGALVVVPLAIAWWPPGGLRRDPRRVLEAAAMLATVVALTELGSRTHSPFAYLAFPALIWAGVRFGQRGASLAVLLTAGLIVWNTTHYAGPFYFHSITRSVLSAQLFIVVAALSTLCLAALVSEREAFAERLGESRAQVFKVAETERRRIERNLHDGAQQRLLALAVNLGLAAAETRRAPERAPALFADAEAELQLAVEELRELAHGTHSTLLTTLGLANAVRSVAARSTVPVTLLELPEARVDGAAEATAYYVVAEAVTNAQKHARASSLAIRAVLVAGDLRVEVVDDGVGGALPGAGSGLEGLRERVEGAGGTFRLLSPPGQGTRIEATIPALPR